MYCGTFLLYLHTQLYVHSVSSRTHFLLLRSSTILRPKGVDSQPLMSCNLQTPKVYGCSCFSRLFRRAIEEIKFAPNRELFAASGSWSRDIHHRRAECERGVAVCQQRADKNNGALWLAPPDKDVISECDASPVCKSPSNFN